MHKSTCENKAVRQSAPRASRNRCLGFALAIVTAICTLPGCSVWQQARRTIWYEPIAYPWKFDRQRSLKAYRSWAEQAWQNESGACPGGPPSEHYELGFKDGFVDFVYAGGDGQPPPVPPRRFWNLKWRSPQGHSAADEWFAGYRHGAKSARAGGYRNLGVVYSSLRSTGHAAMPEPLLLGPPQAVSEDLGPPSEMLPVPAPPSPSELEAPVKEPAASDPATPAAAGGAAADHPAPVLGAPVGEPQADAAARVEGPAPLEVPPPPSPPAAVETEEASPFDAEPAASPQGAALMFRRAISAATNNLPPTMSAPGRAGQAPLGGMAGSQPPPSRPLMPDAGPPAWPDPAVGVENEALKAVLPASAVEDAAAGPLASPSNILRHPKK